MSVLNYERLVAEFEDSLLTKLRGHGPAADYLEMWVPDPDPVKSILNMVEAAEAYGREEIAIEAAKGTLAAGPLEKLRARLGELGQVNIEEAADANLIQVTGMQG